MKRIHCLFMVLVVTSAYGSDGVANFLSAFQSLSLPEKIILPAIPLVVPIVATTYDYFERHYEPKTSEQLDDQLNDLTNIKKDLTDLYDETEKIQNIKNIVDRCAKNATMKAEYDVDGLLIEINFFASYLNGSKNEKTLYSHKIYHALFLNFGCLLDGINNSITTIHTRKKNIGIPFGFFGRLRTVYTKNYRSTMFLLWTSTLFGIALPLWYVHKTMKKTKIVDH